MYDSVLYHSGTKGMRWGYRRWQNEDGSLTPEGRIHYDKGLAKTAKGLRERGVKKAYSKADKAREKLDKAEKETYIKKKKMNKASEDYANASRNTEVKDYNLERAREKGDNALIFTNKRGIKKAEKELSAARANEQAAMQKFKAADMDMANSQLKEVKLRDAYNSRYDKASKKANKYIKRYGAVTMKELMDSDSLFSDSVSNVEKKQRYVDY